MYMKEASGKEIILFKSNKINFSIVPEVSYDNFFITFYLNEINKTSIYYTNAYTEKQYNSTIDYIIKIYSGTNLIRINKQSFNEILLKFKKYINLN